MIYDSRRYFKISFSMNPGHVDKDISLIAWIRVIWLGIIGSDGKKWLGLAAMLDDILWVAVVPLVYCGCISVAPEYSLVCCSGLDDEEGISIIHLLGPNILQ